MRDSTERKYTLEWLQYERPQPMYDSEINKFYERFYQQSPVNNNTLDNDFKIQFLEFIKNHKMNKLQGYEKFSYLDICIGCTQFIDDIYQRIGNNQIMIFENDYKYHWRLNNNIKYTTIDNLDPSKELIISMPFPAVGDVHPLMCKILDRCYQLKIPVHLDGAWLSCSRDINFNFDHPAIQTFAISLSKGGLGGNRIGIRFARQRPTGPITIMNDFNMNCQSLVSMGISFMKEIGPEYFWNKYYDFYFTVCKDFNLIPTKAIHIALNSNNQPVGIRPLLRYLNQHQ